MDHHSSFFKALTPPVRFISRENKEYYGRPLNIWYGPDQCFRTGVSREII